MIVVDFMINGLDSGEFIAGVNFAYKHKLKERIKVGSVYIKDPEIDSYNKMTEYICRLALAEIPKDCYYVIFQSDSSPIVRAARLERKLSKYAVGKTLRFYRKRDLGACSPDLTTLGNDALIRKSTIFVDV